ncbi:hypothetical protein A0H81_01178 [Grifola frondosa]|uniref:Aminoglycoside phosphotransferase domain-containing protein n=1 Tax=Grifola frondosa TaxID=5627 RepID=A0A1C7MQM4_GRIFR|nr:hypothetical protein A0H81_01178 [Grifola frondosa]
MVVLPFWNGEGECFELEGFPDSFHDWTLTSGETPDDLRRSLLDAVETVMQASVVSTRCRAIDLNLTLEAVLESGATVIVRQNYPVEDPVQQAWKACKFDSEVAVLSFVARNTVVPVPQLLAVVRGTDLNFVVMNKMPGVTLMNSFSLLSTVLKEQIILSYAEVALELFRLAVPQKIGTITASGPDQSLELIPSVPDHADRVFDTLAEYIDHLFARKRQFRIANDGTSRSRAMETLDKLEAHTRVIVEHLTTPSFLRCALVHDDFHAGNILIDDSRGCITAVVDWEFHMTQPAILAVAYPSWLLYTGPEDPRFATPTFWWNESPKESTRLCQLYEEIMKSKDREYYAALVSGQNLRCIVRWLRAEMPDVGCDRLHRWMDSTFPSELKLG